MKRLGIINSWNVPIAFGTINACVLFEVDPRPPLPGKLPVALRVEVLGGDQ